MANDTITHNEMTEIWFLGYVIHSHAFLGDVQEGFYFRHINARSGDIYGGKTQREAYEACKQYASQQSFAPDETTVRPYCTTHEIYYDFYLGCPACPSRR